MFEARRFVDDEKIYLDTVKELETDGTAARRFFNSEMKEKRVSDTERQDMLAKGMQKLANDVQEEEQEFNEILNAKKEYLQAQIDSMKDSLRQEFVDSQKQFTEKIAIYERDLKDIEEEVKMEIAGRKKSQVDSQAEFVDKMKLLEQRLDEFEQEQTKEYEDLQSFEDEQVAQAEEQINDDTDKRKQQFDDSEKSITQEMEESQAKMTATWEKTSSLVDELIINCAGETKEREETEEGFVKAIDKIREVIARMQNGRPTV